MPVVIKANTNIPIEMPTKVCHVSISYVHGIGHLNDGYCEYSMVSPFSPVV